MRDFMALYRQWLSDFENDQATRQELLSIQENPAEIEERFYADLAFGTAGMRGVLGAGTNRMNVYCVRRATQGLADVIGAVPGQAERGVVIAYDSRRMSDVFARESACVLVKNGIKVMLFEGLRPVPVLSFAVRHTGAIGGIVITASHNPAKYNGYKVYWEDGAQLPPSHADQVLSAISGHGYNIETASFEQALSTGLLTLVGPEIDSAYEKAVGGLLIDPALAREMGPKLGIVYTPLHGSGSIPVRRVLTQAGFTNLHIVKEQEMPDPDFSTVSVPNPEEPSVYKLALALREKTGADIVLGTDPDCDRVGVCVLDNQGEVHILSGNQIGCLLLEYILRRKRDSGSLPANGAVVKSLVSTQMADVICKRFGVRMVDVLTGFKFIAEQIQSFIDTGRHTFLFGFEESFGYLSSTFVRDKDAVNACLLIAECAAFHKKQGRTLFEALSALYQEYGFHGEKTVSLEYSGIHGLETMQNIMAGLRQNPPSDLLGPVTGVRDYLSGAANRGGALEKLDTPPSDVLYFEVSDGWVCVRPSGTEPKIKLYVGAQADSWQALDERIQKRLARAMQMLGQG